MDEPLNKISTSRYLLHPCRSSLQKKKDHTWTLRSAPQLIYQTKLSPPQKFALSINQKHYIYIYIYRITLALSFDLILVFFLKKLQNIPLYFFESRKAQVIIVFCFMNYLINHLYASISFFQ